MSKMDNSHSLTRAVSDDSFQTNDSNDNSPTYYGRSRDQQSAAPGLPHYQHSEQHQGPTSFSDSTSGNKKKGWSRKRKQWTAMITALVLVVIAVAIAVPIVLIRKRNAGPRSYEQLYFPEGYSGTGMNGVLSSEYRGTKYDQLVVFGSSYSDNAHPRDAQYNTSFAPAGYWQNRWSDGPVWTEYLAKMLGPNVEHLNYAYGGATVNNTIHLTGMPDTAAQIQQYMREHPPADKKPLVAMFTTTNDISYTVRNYLDKTNPIYHDMNGAFDQIEQSGLSLFNQLSNMVTGYQSGTTPDFLILPILPVELSPSAFTLAQGDAGNLDIVRQITLRYNQYLLNNAHELGLRLNTVGQVFSYDVPAWFYSMVQHPSNYNLSEIHSGCMGNSSCTDSANHLWWDGLHLPTKLQQKLARMSANVVLNQSIMP